MKSSYRLSRPALRDIEEISTYIARDNAEAASRVEAAIFDACEKLAQNPYMGKVYDIVRAKPVRVWVIPQFRNYSVVYQPSPRPLNILRVVHGMRNLDRILRKRAGK